MTENQCHLAQNDQARCRYGAQPNSGQVERFASPSNHLWVEHSPIQKGGTYTQEFVLHPEGVLSVCVYLSWLKQRESIQRERLDIDITKAFEGIAMLRFAAPPGFLRKPSRAPPFLRLSLFA